MEVWMTVIGEYGFPIAITFYLLYRIEKKLDMLHQSVMYLARIIQNTQAKLNETDESPLAADEEPLNWNVPS